MKVKKATIPNPMMLPHIEKVTINIGVGEAGERLEKAETVLEDITKHKPVQTLSKTVSKDLALRKRMPIGCKVTLRGTDAKTFLKQAFETRENKIGEYAFDHQRHIRRFYSHGFQMLFLEILLHQLHGG